SLLPQVAPGVVPITIAPVLGMTIGKDLGTVRPCVLSGDQTVEGIVSKALVAARIAVVGDSPDISVVARAQVEVIDQIHERPDGRGRPQGGGLDRKSVV